MPSSTRTSTSCTATWAYDGRSTGGNMMKLTTLLTSMAATILLAGAAQAQIAVKLGVLNDMSGVYADISGPGSVVAAQMAVEDSKAAAHGINIEIVSARHQNKPDVGSSIAPQG